MKKSEKLPFGRAIVDRRTGLLAGPVAPVYEEDWPYKGISDSEVLWRYMDLFKFKDLVESSTLYLARPDKFVDPFEGRLCPGNDNERSKSEAAFRDLYRIADSHGEPYSETHRKLVFILCWHRNTRENRRMWNITESPKSVAITTSGKALRRFTSPSLLKSAVKYAPLDRPRTEFDHNSLFFYKPTEYAFEREFRLLRQPAKGETFRLDDSEDEYRRVPIRLRKIVHRIILHPEAEEDTIDEVWDLVFRHLQGVPLVRSSMDMRRRANRVSTHPFMANPTRGCHLKNDR